MKWPRVKILRVTRREKALGVEDFRALWSDYHFCRWPHHVRTLTKAEMHDAEARGAFASGDAGENVELAPINGSLALAQWWANMNTADLRTLVQHLPPVDVPRGVDSRIPVKLHLEEDAFRRPAIQSAFAVAQALNRTLVLPRAVPPRLWQPATVLVPLQP